MTEPTDERLLELAEKAQESVDRDGGQSAFSADVARLRMACSPDRIRALVEGKRRAEEALRVELDELLKRNEGRTHYPGCEKEHPMCTAIGRIRAALPQPERGGGA
jgi:hypothetical protein